MEKGVADAVTFPWGSIVLFGIDKVTKYHMDVALYTDEFQWVMNKSTYAQMSPSQQKVIDDHCTTEWAEKVRRPWADFEHDGMPSSRPSPARRSIKITDAQLAEWKTSAEPLVRPGPTR
jgi:TRAP-type C4-dicarboxylate transport system substrate-binding protein